VKRKTLLEIVLAIAIVTILGACQPIEDDMPSSVEAELETSIVEETAPLEPEAVVDEIEEEVTPSANTTLEEETIVEATLDEPVIEQPVTDVSVSQTAVSGLFSQPHPFWVNDITQHGVQLKSLGSNTYAFIRTTDSQSLWTFSVSNNNDYFVGISPDQTYAVLKTPGNTTLIDLTKIAHYLWQHSSDDVSVYFSPGSEIGLLVSYSAYSSVTPTSINADFYDLRRNRTAQGYFDRRTAQGVQVSLAVDETGTQIVGFID
jgi:hypothetical protein